MLAGLTPSNHIVGSLLRTKSEFGKFTSMEKCTQLLLIECILQSQIFTNLPTTIDNNNIDLFANSKLTGGSAYSTVAY